MLQQVVSNYSDLKSRLASVGDPLVLRLYDRVIVSIRVGSRERLESQARDLQSYLWECLHYVNWKDIHCSYRDAFGTAAFIVALCEAERNEDGVRNNFIASIKTVDMGLLLGSDYMKSMLQDLAATLQKNSNIAMEKNSANRVAPKRKRQPPYSQNNPSQFISTPVPLPPNSPNPNLCSSITRLRRLALADFYRDFFIPGHPVVLLGTVDHWPAINGPRCWKNLFYLKTVAGSRTVPVETGVHYLSPGSGQRLISLSEFINTYILNEPQLPMTGTDNENYHQTQSQTQRTMATSGAIIKTEVMSSPNSGIGIVKKSHSKSKLNSSALNNNNNNNTSNAHGGADIDTDNDYDSDYSSEIHHSPRGPHSSHPAHGPTPPPRQVGYLAQHQLFDQIPELRNDFDTPDYCALLAPEDNDRGEVVVNAWLGPQGTMSPLHHDPFHNLLVQVVGYKLIRLYSPACTAGLYPLPGRMYNNSSVDIMNPDISKHPLFHNMPYSETVLGPGDTLFIPRWTWHFVLALDAATARAKAVSLDNICNNNSSSSTGSYHKHTTSNAYTTGTTTGMKAGAESNTIINNNNTAATTAASTAAEKATGGRKGMKSKSYTTMTGDLASEVEESPHCFSVNFWWGERREKK